MDPRFNDMTDPTNNSKLEDQTVLSSFDQPLHKDESSNEQSAEYAEEVELAEMFDMVLLCTHAKGKKVSTDINSEISSEGKETKISAVDLRTLLTSCAQAVASGDQESASEKLKQIRQESSPTGDKYQRLASVFADGLEARLSRGGATLSKGGPIGKSNI